GCSWWRRSPVSSAGKNPAWFPRAAPRVYVGTYTGLYPVSWRLSSSGCLSVSIRQTRDKVFRKRLPRVPHTDVGCEYSFLGSIRSPTFKRSRVGKTTGDDQAALAAVMEPDRHTIPHTRVSLPLIQNPLVLTALEEFIADLQMIKIPDEEPSSGDENPRLRAYRRCDFVQLLGKRFSLDVYAHTQHGRNRLLLLLDRFEKNAGGFLPAEKHVVRPLEVDCQRSRDPLFGRQFF